MKQKDKTGSELSSEPSLTVTTVTEVQRRVRVWTEGGRERVWVPPGAGTLLDRWWQEAALALARLPRCAVGPRTPRSGWPQVVRSYWECYGREAARSPRLAATARQIDWLDTLLAAIWRLRTADRAVLLMRLLIHPVDGRNIYSWRAVGRVLDENHETAKARFGRAREALLAEIVRHRLWPEGIDEKRG